MSAVTQTILLALARQSAGDIDAARALLEAVLTDEPDHAAALYPLGLLHLASGRPGDAVVCLARASRARPDHVGTWINLARARLALGDLAHAEQAASRAVALAPALGEAQFQRGSALAALGRPDQAEAALRQAVALEPRHAPAHLHLANACCDLDRLEEGAALCRMAIDLDPALAEAHASLGFALTGLGRLDEAVAACDAAIALRPGFVQAHWNRATARLLAGDYAEGFRGYEWRKRHDRFRRDFIDLPGPVWQGEALAGRTILVRAEQGLGDTIQFARYLPLLAARGGRVVLSCARPLVPLLRNLPGLAAVADREATPPPHDTWIDQMSLPSVFGTEPATIPLAGGYLAADPDRVADWRARLADRPGPLIGLVWAGNPAHSNDRRRSLPAAAVRALAAVLVADRPAQLVSLQVGPRAGEAVSLLGIEDRSADLPDYAETAALVSALDLLVTVDTSLAHLAGALGRPAWVMLPFGPDWRWMLGRDDTPWYKSLRLFRQHRPADWQAPVRAVGAALAASLDATGMFTIP